MRSLPDSQVVSMGVAMSHDTSLRAAVAVFGLRGTKTGCLSVLILF